MTSAADAFRLTAGGVLAVAAQFDPVPGLFAVVAAILAVGTIRRHQTLADRMRALHTGFSHNAPPRQHSTPLTGPPAIRLICVAAVACLAVGVPPLAAQAPERVDLAETLARVSGRLQQWYARATRVTSTEEVWIQSLRADLTPLNFPRRLAFDLRIEWDPDRTGPDGAPVANILREPVRIDGKFPNGNDPGCMDPKLVSPEPLAMLLAARHDESEFSLAGTERVDGRQAIKIDYRGVVSLPEEITWTDDCVSLVLPGRSRGRVWIDAATYDVLRMDDRLVGMFEFDVPRDHVRRGAARSMVVERAESSIRYRRVAFQDPEEALLLPASIDSLTVIRGGSTQRVRITQRFSDYRRFLTEGRIVD